MIAEYTGNANNFKSGLVWEEDPQWGDKVSITVIATGFKKDIPSMINPSNIIMIDSDFRYDKAQVSSALGRDLDEDDGSPTSAPSISTRTASLSWMWNRDRASVNLKRLLQSEESPSETIRT